MLLFIKCLDALASIVILSERVLVLCSDELGLFVPKLAFDDVD